VPWPALAGRRLHGSPFALVAALCRGPCCELFAPNFEEGERPPGFRSRRARVGYELGSELIGCSLWEVPPGEAAYPYHYHYGDEELVTVISGRPTLRSPDGTRELERGDVVRFLPLAGRGTSDPQPHRRHRYVPCGQQRRPDIVIYPDSNELGVGERLPHGGGLRAFFHRELAVDYWDREEPPSE
jgi:uncharacterized cupin superfamily protein